MVGPTLCFNIVEDIICNEAPEFFFIVIAKGNDREFGNLFWFEVGEMFARVLHRKYKI